LELSLFRTYINIYKRCTESARHKSVSFVNILGMFKEFTSFQNVNLPYVRSNSSLFRLRNEASNPENNDL